MGIVNTIQSAVALELQSLYGYSLLPEEVPVTETKPEFEGDYTVLLFSFVKALRKAPEAAGRELGARLVTSNPTLFPSYSVIKGFLNLSIGDTYWQQFLYEHHHNTSFGFASQKDARIVVEYSSPNTNKPLHLGHLRNNFLGWSISEILKATGAKVIRTCIVNDRGIHICKSMVAWQKFGKGATPLTTGIKGDHLVGDYYVMFENELKSQAASLLAKVKHHDLSDFNEETKEQLTHLHELAGGKAESPEKIKEANAAMLEIVRNSTPIMQEVRQMLRKWEEGDAETLNLWRQMNNWVYEGFDTTYRNIGSAFDKIYYESETYLQGKAYVEEGLASGVFKKHDDGSVWIDLSSEGLDEKLVLRSDGTSVYITQDIGLARQKYEDFKMDESIYLIGDEQIYHMKVLKLICQKLGIPNADNILHLSYGMVDLPTGRMKSREGTVVDADDLVEEMENISAKHTLELGKVAGFTEDELKDLYHTIGLGALKFYLLRVDPKKRMVFNPEESIDFHGYTGPFIQYTHARTRSILRKESPRHEELKGALLPLEKKLIRELEKYPVIIEQAARELNPSVVANYAFHLAQLFNSFIAELRVLNAESAEKKELRLQLSQLTVYVISSSMSLLGIKVPERM